MPAPELRQPNLPASARRVAKGLRRGWSTGTCAAAAAKAAAVALESGHAPASIDVPLPGADRRCELPVESCELRGDEAMAVVVKDAGDDPDVTDGARLTAALARRAAPGVELAAGEGVGIVTKPGLGLELGAPAINPVPRKQIAAALAEVIDLDSAGATVTISVPGGERMARRTTNPRLGIVGGISILGTTGIVRPFSTASWLASVVQAVDVIAATEQSDVVLTTGGRTEQAAMALLPGRDHVSFIEVGDFTGHALRRASERGLARCIFVGMAGKLSKLAAGVMMTHWTRSKVDPELLSGIVREGGGGEAVVAAVAEANTARHAYELWRAAGLDAPGDLLCARVADNLERFVDRRVEVHALLVDFEDLSVTGASPRARGLIEAGADRSVADRSGADR